jgi:hypothetical protein
MGCQHSSSVTTVEEVYNLGGSTPTKPQRPRASRECDSTFVVRLEKSSGDKLGLGLGSTSGGAVVFSIKPGGLLDQHNLRSGEEHQVFPGCIVVEVNGQRGYWTIFEELTRLGPLEMRISTIPPHGVSSNWFQEIESLGKEMEARGSPFMLRLQPEHPDCPAASFSSVPTVRAGELNVDQCAICLEDVSPDAKLMQLPCGHAFHMLCAGRWLTEGGKHSSGKRQCCPLCCQKVTDRSAKVAPEVLQDRVLPTESLDDDVPTERIN